jgi:hypothetical protein
LPKNGCFWAVGFGIHLSGCRAASGSTINNRCAPVRKSSFFSWEYDYVSEAQEEAKGGENQQIQEVVVSDSNANAGYANFCRVSSTPEELILDLGLNPTPYATGKVEVKVTHRIILNHYTAKRLWHALSMALQRHEQAFGVLETDVRKRVRLPQGG